MTAGTKTILAAGCGGLLLLSRAAGLEAARVRQAKEATPLVDVRARKAFGSAFCIDRSGYFLTNAHVVEQAGGKEVRLVLLPGTEAEKVVSAKVVRLDKENDIALLKAGTEASAALELGSDGDLAETAEVTTFGYPFGDLLATEENAYPSTTINVGRITSLRTKQGKLDEIQLDALVNPGNSGGPVLDGAGAVIGMIARGIPKSGVNFAIPVSKLRAFLRPPLLEPQFPAAVAWTNRHSAVELPVAFTPLPGSSEVDAVEIVLGVGRARHTARAERAEPLRFVAHTPLIPEDAGKPTVRLALALALDGGSFEGRALDSELETADGKVRLRQLRSATFGDAPAVVTAEGRQTALAAPETQHLDILLAGREVTIPCGSIESLTVYAEPVPDGQLYEVRAMCGTEVIARVEGSIPFSDLPAPAATAAKVAAGASTGGAAPEITVPGGLGDEPLAIELPAPCADVVLAGGGRYVLLPLPKLQKLAVLDTGTARVEEYMPLPVDNAMVVGGLTRFVIFSPGDNIAQVWRLRDRKCVLTQKLPITGIVTDLAMGHASEGPLLVRWAVGSGALDRAAFAYLDLDRLETVAACEGNGHSSCYRDAVQLRMSADGSVCGTWNTSCSPSGLNAMLWENGKPRVLYEHTSVGYIAPGPDGRYLYTGKGGVFLPNLKAAGQSPGTIMTLPTTLPAYYLGFVPAADAKSRSRLSLFVPSSTRPLVDLPAPAAIEADPYGRDRGGVAFDKRLLCIPQAELLIVIPRTDDKVLLSRCDIKQALAASGVDYLFVESVPPVVVRAGSVFVYAVRVMSRSGGVKYRLDSGPAGMAVSETGRLTWNVPARQEKEESVILTITDASGQQIFHTFPVRIAG